MKRMAWLCLFVLTPLLAAAGTPEAEGPDVWTLRADAWAGPRRGEELVRNPLLKQVVERLGEQGRLRIQHAPDEESALWAQELKSWLIALGIPSSRIETHAGFQQDDALTLRIQY